MQPAMRSLAGVRSRAGARLAAGTLAAAKGGAGKAAAQRALCNQARVLGARPVSALSPIAAKHPALRAQARGVSDGSAGGLDDVRKDVWKIIDDNPAKFGKFKENKEMEQSTFQELFDLICPGIGREETKALFVSMDASNDGIIQEPEIFSDITMSIVRTRMKCKEVVHPIMGSYYCLPNPPFHADPKQLEAVKMLQVVYDEVLAGHLKPVPAVPVTPKQATPPAQAASIFASFFGGVRKTKPKSPAPEAKLTALVPKPNAPKGAYLYGGCGCGKTVLLDLFFRSLPDGFTARRLHWHEFIRDGFRAMQGHPPGENVFESMGEALAKQFRVLLLDELVITHISEAILVKNLFRQLWARGVTIITTSNYRPEELYAKGFNRDQFVDFIPELAAQCPVFEMSNNKDYRQMDSVPSDRFLHPLGEETTAKFDQLWKGEVRDTEAKDLNLVINYEKRSLRVPIYGVDAQGARAARFSFKELCVANLGRADYSTIAEHFHTVFIDDVPKYTADLGAEFRRFVSLTDILYGKKVQIFMSSEAHTDELFAASMTAADLDLDELWAFRRCSSMLSEMQNPKYLNMVWLMRNHLLQETAMKL